VNGIDICKDAVSLPGWLYNTFVRFGTTENKLYAPDKEAYKHEHLKAAVSGGPSIVFTRYHEAGVTRIRSHEKTVAGQQAKPSKRILGYDANAHYLSTMLNDMPCRKKKVTDYEDPVQTATDLKSTIISGKLLGFLEVQTDHTKSPVDKI